MVVRLLDATATLPRASREGSNVAEVVSWIPEPIGAVASGVAAVGNVISAAKVVGKVASAAGRGASVATKATAEFFRNGNDHLRIGKPNALSRVASCPARPPTPVSSPLGPVVTMFRWNDERTEMSVGWATS